jgi:hypothetical protein
MLWGTYNVSIIHVLEHLNSVVVALYFIHFLICKKSEYKIRLEISIDVNSNKAICLLTSSSPSLTSKMYCQCNIYIC